MTESGETLLTPSDRDRLRDVEERMASDGLRVLAIARKRTPRLADAERHMTLLGFVGIMDPPGPKHGQRWKPVNTQASSPS